jgi:hypothetical protein
MTIDLLAALDEPCGKCGGSVQVTWCPAWDVYLCADCKIVRADAELRTPLADKQAMQSAATLPEVA